MACACPPLEGALDQLCGGERHGCCALTLARHDSARSDTSAAPTSLQAPQDGDDARPQRKRSRSPCPAEADRGSSCSAPPLPPAAKLAKPCPPAEPAALPACEAPTGPAADAGSTLLQLASLLQVLQADCANAGRAAHSYAGRPAVEALGEIVDATGATLSAVQSLLARLGAAMLGGATRPAAADTALAAADCIISQLDLQLNLLKAAAEEQQALLLRGRKAQADPELQDTCSSCFSSADALLL